jgi:hypothetical protein
VRIDREARRHQRGAGRRRDAIRLRDRAGGRERPDFRKPGAIVVSRNITSDPEDGIGKWSDAQIMRAIVDGIRPDGTRLGVTMPFAWYKRITPADLDAIVAFIRTIPPAR